MGQMKRRIVVALTAALAVVPGAAGASRTPTPIEFVVPAGTGLTEGPDGDRIHVFGRSSGSVPVGDCSSVAVSAEHPRQSAKAIDPQGGRPSKIHEIITTSQTEPVIDGTRITDLVGQGSCFENRYDKYRGLAE